MFYRGVWNWPGGNGPDHRVVVRLKMIALFKRIIRSLYGA